MTKVKVDLLSKEEKKLSKQISKSAEADTTPKISGHRTKKRYDIKKLIASVIIVIVISMAVFSSSVVFSDENLIKNLSKLDLFGQVGRLIGSKNKVLVGEESDRINVLLIGMGGAGHEGGTLADTIILGSFKPSTNQVAMMSIPRDLSVPAEGYGWIKVNALHAYAEKDYTGQGGETMAKSLSDLLGIEINYFATVDFSGFEKLIDEFGGVDIDVERDLIDPEFPIRGKEYVFPIENRYETLNISAGERHMDGELALKYARSRHALGIEGSDFARSRRQQKILAALKDKIFSIGTFLNPKRINSLLSAYNEHIYTNFEIWEMLRLAQLGKDIDPSKIISQTLSDGPSGMLYPKIVNGAYVLLPDDGNYEEIKNLWQNIFYAPGGESLTSGKPAKEAPTELGAGRPDITELEDEKLPEEEPEKLPEPVANYKQETATIEIQNGTWINGHAGAEKAKLTSKDFNVVSASNADNHEYKSTIIYDLSDGEFPGTSAELFKIYGVRPSSTVPPALDSDNDFIIILGTS